MVNNRNFDERYAYYIKLLFFFFVFNVKRFFVLYLWSYICKNIISIIFKNLTQNKANCAGTYTF